MIANRLLAGPAARAAAQRRRQEYEHVQPSSTSTGPVAS